MSVAQRESDENNQVCYRVIHKTEVKYAEINYNICHV